MLVVVVDDAVVEVVLAAVAIGWVLLLVDGVVTVEVVELLEPVLPVAVVLADEFVVVFAFDGAGVVIEVGGFPTRPARNWRSTFAALTVWPTPPTLTEKFAQNSQYQI